MLLYILLVMPKSIHNFFFFSLIPLLVVSSSFRNLQVANTFVDTVFDLNNLGLRTDEFEITDSIFRSTYPQITNAQAVRTF